MIYLHLPLAEANLILKVASIKSAITDLERKSIQWLTDGKQKSLNLNCFLNINFKKNKLLNLFQIMQHI